MSWTRPSAEEQRAKREAASEANREVLVNSAARGGSYGGTTQPLSKQAPPRFRLSMKVNNKVRESARGEDCTVRIPGICANDPAATIWSHARWEVAGKGGQTKALDLCGAYCCTACDAVYDGQRPRPDGYSQWDIDRLWMFGHFRSLVRLGEKGLVKP